MTLNSRVRSNASNFIEQLQTGVDARTGQFTVNLKLPTVQAHDRRGPALDIALAYNALTPIDAGYGLGWDIPLSQFRQSKGLLTTNSGENFKIISDPTQLGRMTVGQQKLESFHFYRDSAAVFRLVHRSGEVEFLEERGSGEFRTAVPVQICTPQGHRLNLDYDTYGGHPYLSRVHQSDGETLLRIERAPGRNTVVLSFNPDISDQPGPSYTLHLDAEGKLERFELPTDEKATWAFDYQKIRDMWCVVEMRTPMGGVERLEYADGGHHFPTSANRPTLPRVTRHLRHPTADGDPVDIRYQYCMDAQRPDARNFLGYELNYSWLDDGLDYLYQHRGDYRYGTIETYWTNDGNGSPRALRSINRHYNRYHLLVLEQTSQGEAVARQTITYNLHDDTHFDQQPATCQLPIETQYSWWLTSASSEVYHEKESRTYDHQGNLRTLTRRDGVQEISEYYPAEGEDGDEGVCPANPEGFVSYLKRQVTIPVAGPGNAATLVKRFDYRALPALRDPERADLADWHTVTQERTLQLDNQQEVELTRHEYTYVNDIDVPFLHGRVVMKVTTRDFLPTVVTHAFSQLRADQTLANVPVVQTQETLSGWDGSVSTSLVQESAFTGDVVLREDTEGVQVLYEYDALGRPQREILAPEDPQHRAENTWQYYLHCTEIGEAPGTSTTSVGGVTTRTYVDGFGRVIGEARDHIDKDVPQRLHETLEVRYDALGQTIERTEHDWYQNNPQPLVTRFEYDDWGQCHRTTTPDGVIHHEQAKPTREGMVIRSWRSSGDRINAMTEASMNRFQAPDQLRTLDASGTLLWTRNFTYDGLGRIHRQTDEHGDTQSFTYDALGRLSSTRLPDGTVLEHGYAAHAEAALLTEVALVPEGDRNQRAILGSQAFDSLHRRTRTDVGKQSHRYHYQGGRNRPSSYTTPAGAKIELSYLLNLTGAPIASVAPDQTCSYGYDPRNAQLERATSEEGERQYEYDNFGHLIREQWTGKDQVTWTTRYQPSLHGRIHLREDQTRTPTRYTYDAAGRVSSMTCEQVTVTYRYDTLGRLEHVTTTDRAGGSEQVTTHGYDDHDRETSRTTRVTGQPTRTLEQTWYPGERLKSRTLTEEGTLLLGETFAYDNRARLSIYSCTGSELPRDELGRPISKEIFLYDGFDNIKVVTTTIEGKLYRTLYTPREDDPCKLASIQHLPARPGLPIPPFEYDANGNLLNDEAGRRLCYDTQSRLLSVTDASSQVLTKYHYDGNGDLHAVQATGQQATQVFFEGYRLSLAIGNAQAQRVLYNGEGPVAQQACGEPGQTLLLQTNASHSVIAEYHLGELRKLSYGAYGSLPESEQAAAKGLLRFNGELATTALGWYLLGRGYRVYNERIRRFHSPDSLTVFDGGDINPYSYCRNDPVNFRDPSGHEGESSSGRRRSPVEDEVPTYGGGGGNWEGWLMLGVGLIATVAAVFTAGSSISALVAAASVTAGMIAKATVLTIIAAGAVISYGMQIYATIKQDEKANMIAFAINIAVTFVSIMYAAFTKMASLFRSFRRQSGSPAARSSRSSIVRSNSTTSASSVSDDAVPSTSSRGSTSRRPSFISNASLNAQRSGANSRTSSIAAGGEVNQLENTIPPSSPGTSSAIARTSRSSSLASDYLSEFDRPPLNYSSGLIWFKSRTQGWIQVSEAQAEQVRRRWEQAYYGRGLFP
ncbi:MULTISPECIES: RHS repeat domain-containing protein [Pseudomonas]|uniref:RHS repeat domain-containing protein n=1 Tax=Pseudomonas sp. NY5710 TaxID=2662033 RepID=UPI00156DD087|nr:RHS repeat-associated core domain-containing protein [Pseudomonas sp. NY5710]